MTLFSAGRINQAIYFQLPFTRNANNLAKKVTLPLEFNNEETGKHVAHSQATLPLREYLQRAASTIWKTTSVCMYQ